MKKRKIIDIQVQSRRKNRKNIFFDDGSVFGVSEDVFLSIPIKIGDIISDQKLNDILESESKSKVYNSAINLLSYRMRSKSELNERLIRKGYSKDIITDVINILELKGYIDDEKFAIAFAKEKVKNKLIGPNALKFEISSHNLDLDLVDNTIDSIYEMFPQEMIINRLIAKWKVGSSIKKDLHVKSKVINRLKNKGFYWVNIENVINAIDDN
ncbi:MAG: hypothetical protein CMG15_00785 [Candidatus Marinimicrobia bacterium]|nr:hypothetical protein [Candidatus Neomarinimicrobiota bacterium]